MNTDKLQAIADLSASRLKELFMENADEINRAIATAYEQAQDAEKETGDTQPIKLALGHAITLDLVGNKQTDRLTWSVRYKAELSGEIPDPDRPELPLGTMPAGRAASARKGGRR